MKISKKYTRIGTVLAFVVATTTAAHANIIAPCQFLQTLAELPMKQQLSRQDENAQADFYRSYRQMQLFLTDESQMAIFSKADQSQIFKFADELRLQQSLGAGAVPLSTMFVVDLLHKFTCADFSTDGNAIMKGTNDDPARYAWIIGLLSLLALVMASYKLRSQQRKDQKICRTQALMTFGNKCTITHVLDISVDGAKFEATSKELPSRNVDLHLCDHHIAARVAWQNKLYGGLKFNTPISEEKVAEIVAESHDLRNEMRTSAMVPHCYSPGCHVGCDRHLLTALQARKDRGHIG